MLRSGEIARAPARQRRRHSQLRELHLEALLLQRLHVALRKDRLPTANSQCAWVRYSCGVPTDSAFVVLQAGKRGAARQVDDRRVAVDAAFAAHFSGAQVAPSARSNWRSTLRSSARPSRNRASRNRSLVDGAPRAWAEVDVTTDEYDERELLLAPLAPPWPLPAGGEGT